MVKALPTEEFLVSFLVDARGGFMQAQRLPQLKIFVPADAAPSPTRIICHLLKPERLNTLPELNDCDGFASRILQIHSSCPRFQKPILIEVPHIASLRNGEREIVTMRKNFDSQNWKEHSTTMNKDALKETFGEFYDSLTPEEDLESHRIRRIFTTDIPNYFCLISRFQRDSCHIGQEGGSIESKVDSRIKIRFPPSALMKKIQISLEVQKVDPAVVTQVLGEQHQVSLSPIITVEPKRRKFRDFIEIQMPLPKGVDKADLSNLRILFSISEFVTKWEDVTNSTELMMQDDYVTHSTKISARVWLISAPGVEDVSELANRIYAQHCCTPYIGRFLAFARRHDPEECQLRVILITDDSSDKTLECQESFELIATGPEVEIISKLEYQIETAGNLVPVTKSDETIQFPVQPFLENRLTVPVRMRNHEEKFSGKVAFIPDYKSKIKQVIRPVTTLDIEIPDKIIDMIGSLRMPAAKKRVKNAPIERVKGCEAIAKTELDLQSVAERISGDWPHLATELGMEIADVNLVINESCTDEDKAYMTLIQWQSQFGNQATGNELNRALRTIGREDVVKSCMGDISFVEDENEAHSAREQLKNDGKGYHDASWDDMLKLKQHPTAYSESVDDSMIAETGDDWSERNKDEDKDLSDASEEKSLVGSPIQEMVDEAEVECIIDTNRKVAQDDIPSVDKTEAYLSLINGLDNLLSEQEDVVDVEEDSPEQAQEGFISQQPLMSSMPMNMDCDLEEYNEEMIIPVDSNCDVKSQPKWTETTLDGQAEEAMIESCVPDEIVVEEPTDTQINEDLAEYNEEMIVPVDSKADVKSQPKRTETNTDDQDEELYMHESCVPDQIIVDLDNEIEEPTDAQIVEYHEEYEEQVIVPVDSKADVKSQPKWTETTAFHQDDRPAVEEEQSLISDQAVPISSQEKHSVLHEVFEGEPQTQTEVEEEVEILPDGSIRKLRTIKKQISHTITEKTTREVTPEEAERLLAQKSEEPAEVVEIEQELEDGSIVKRTVTTTKTTSVITSKTTSDGEIDPDKEASSAPLTESVEILNPEVPPKSTKSRNKKHRKSKQKSSQS